MPCGATILSVQTHKGHPKLWALVDTDAPSETRFFCVVGTGHLVDFKGAYIGTFQFDFLKLVFHLFEVFK